MFPKLGPNLYVIEPTYYEEDKPYSIKHYFIFNLPIVKWNEKFIKKYNKFIQASKIT